MFTLWVYIVVYPFVCVCVAKVLKTAVDGQIEVFVVCPSAQCDTILALDEFLRLSIDKLMSHFVDRQ